MTPPSPRAERVLVVDDDPVTRMVLARGVNQEGFVPITFSYFSWVTGKTTRFPRAVARPIE